MPYCACTFFHNGLPQWKKYTVYYRFKLLPDCCAAYPQTSKVPFKLFHGKINTKKKKYIYMDQTGDRIG
jgi:hypothetical protein